MLSGFDGVRYGLTVPKKESKPGIKKGLSLFAEDDSEGEKGAVGRNIERQAQRKLADQKVAKLQAAALQEDPSIFDYDSHFETMQTEQEAKRPAASQARKSRYIESLLEKNKEREREQDIIYERRLLRERKAEDHLFGDKDKFVTAAYKKKLEEDKKWLEEEAVREKKEAEDDVRKRGHMGDFYRNLLANNVAFGTADPKRSKPAEVKPAIADADPANVPSQPPDPEWERMRRAREAFEARQAQDGSGEGRSTAELNTKADISPADLPEDTKGKDNMAASDELPLVPDFAETNIVQLSKEDKAGAARERYLARKRKAPA